MMRESDMHDTDRADRIWRHPVYQEHFLQLQKAERTREFCRHTLAHFLDVARIAHIWNLEYGLGIPKDILYAAALLHDICSFQKESRTIRPALLCAPGSCRNAALHQKRSCACKMLFCTTEGTAPAAAWKRPLHRIRFLNVSGAQTNVPETASTALPRTTATGRPAEECTGSAHSALLKRTRRKNTAVHTIPVYQQKWRHLI